MRQHLREEQKLEKMNPMLVVGYHADTPKGLGDRRTDAEKMIRFAKNLHVPWKKVVGANRRRDYVEVRQLICKYLKQQGWTYREIGDFLGKRDHSTAVYAVKAAQNLIDTDREIRMKWLKLLQS